MRIDTGNSVRSVFNMMPRVRVSFSVADEKIEPENAAPRKSEEQLEAELYERTAQYRLDSDDIDKDGLLSKDEYMAGQKRLADADHRLFDLAAEEARWAKLDPTGKGALNKDELIAGLKVVLPVTAHYLEPGAADRIKQQAQEAASKTLGDFGDAFEEEGKNQSLARSIRNAAEASALSLFGEAE